MPRTFDELVELMAGFLGLAYFLIGPQLAGHGFLVTRRRIRLAAATPVP